MFSSSSAANGHRWLSAAALLSTAALVLTACGSGEEGDAGTDDKSPFVVALTGDATGNQTSLYPGALGAQAALKKINSEGGINGRQIEIKGIFDSKSTAEGGTASAQQAVAAEPSVIISSNVSASESGATAVYSRTGIPVFAMSGTEPNKVPPTAWSFGLGVATKQIAAVMVAKAKLVLGGSLQGKKIAFAGLSAPAIDETLNYVKELAKTEGFEVAPIERTPPGNTAFATQAAGITAAGVDLVFTQDSTPGTIVIAKALAVAGYDGPVISTHGASQPEVFAEIANDSFMAYRAASVPADNKESGLYKFAIANGVTAEQLTNPYFSQGWAQAYAAAEVLKSCEGACDPEAFEAAAQKLTSYEVPDGALFGPVTLSPQRHYGLSTFQFYEWDGSKVVTSGDPITLQD